MNIWPEGAWKTNSLGVSKLADKNVDFCCAVCLRLLTESWVWGKFAECSMALSWGTRMKIAVGAAKGLAFLHEGDKPVIYRDFKASNILIDSVSSLIFNT